MSTKSVSDPQSSAEQKMPTSSTSHLQKMTTHVSQFKPKALAQKLKQWNPGASKTVPQPGIKRAASVVSPAITKSKSEQLKKMEQSVLSQQWSESDDHNTDDLSLAEINDIDYIIVEAKPKTSVDVLMENVFGDITLSSACRQFFIGGVVGWTAGYLGIKLWTFSAFSVSCSLVMLQIRTFYEENCFLGAGYLTGFILAVFL